MSGCAFVLFRRGFWTFIICFIMLDGLLNNMDVINSILGIPYQLYTSVCPSVNAENCL